MIFTGKAPLQTRLVIFCGHLPVQHLCALFLIRTHVHRCTNNRQTTNMRALFFCLAWVLSALTCSASMQEVRELPARIVHSAQDELEPFEDDLAEAMSVPVTEIKVKLPVPWFKEYMAYKSHQVSLLLMNDNKPLALKFTNFEKTASDENDLRSWTRYIIDYDRDDANEAEDDSEKSIDVSIDEFIGYLVEEKGFIKEDLQFLHSTDLDYGYEQVEEEISSIYERQRAAKQIEVWGEAYEARLSCAIRTSFHVTAPVVAILAYFLSF